MVENKWATWFKRAMWLGIIQDLVLALPAVFIAPTLLDALGLRQTGDRVWTGFAALLLVLLPLFYIPGAIDPYKHRYSAIMGVLARPPGVFYFLILNPGTYNLFGYIDAFMILIQVPTLIMAYRTGPPRGWRPRDMEDDYRFGYDGSTFNEVKEVAWSGQYDGKLPKHRGLGPTRFVQFFNHSARNLIDKRDVLPPFDKLIHANGICYTGVWRINAATPYTGGFSQGAEGLALVRASVAGPFIKRGWRRSFGLGVKVWPTMNPDERHEPGNVVVVSGLSGTRNRNVSRIEMTNAPTVGWSPGANLINRVIFRLMDSRPGWRQLHPVSTLGLSPGDEVRTPDLIRFRIHPDTPKINRKDFRDEMRLEHYPDNKLVYLIDVKNWDDEEWAEIGTLELTDYAISLGGDKQLHFWIPRDSPAYT